jgi:hypothetical protein
LKTPFAKALLQISRMTLIACGLFVPDTPSWTARPHQGGPTVTARI